MGDPSGIGPEIVVRALARTPKQRHAKFAAIVFGDEGALGEGARRAGLRASLAKWTRLPPPPWEDQQRRALSAGEVAFSPVGRLDPNDQRPGRPTRAGGRAQLAYVDAALDAVLGGFADALVTAPVSKHTIAKAGVRFIGHTEHLARRVGARNVAMLFAGRSLRVALATTHVPLAEVARAFSAKRVAEVTVLLARALADDFGIRAPRIAVAALNPHAGEGGLLGGEERRIIAPAIALARRRLARDPAVRGATVVGPVVADAVFRRARAGEFDGVVAMYHDQATIAVKLDGPGNSVNVTLGLPFVRTSVDHGVAYDVAETAGRRPDAWPLCAALDLAARLTMLRRPSIRVTR